MYAFRYFKMGNKFYKLKLNTISLLLYYLYLNFCSEKYIYVALILNNNIKKHQNSKNIIRLIKFVVKSSVNL